MMNRRQFFQSTAAASVALQAPFVLAQSPGHKFRTALIGSGWWGRNILKEAMACAVPVIYGLHTGMRDLGLKGLPLIHNEAISGSHEYFFPSNDIDWYESDPEEIDAQLEWVYQNREKARRAALSVSDFIRSTRTWAQHVTELKAWLKE